MAAIFITNSNKDIFTKGVTFKVPYGAAALESIWADGMYTIVTDVSVQTSEILQHFIGFDDLITTLHFGKNVGAITISGIMFSNCAGSLPGINRFYTVVGEKREKSVTLSLGGYAFQGIIANTSVQLTANPDTMAFFTIQMNMTGHTLPGRPDNTGLGFNGAGGALGGSSL